MDILLFVLGLIILIVGFIGCVLPILPGQAVAFLSLILLQFMDPPRMDGDTIWTMAGFMVIVTVLDYIVPIYGTKRFGGTKRGVWGSTIGLIFGIFILPPFLALGPFGILICVIAGPFIGAYIGELTGNRESKGALIAAFGSFIGFLTGTLLKLTYAGVCAFFFFKYTFAHPIW
jgi:hypothetical protein